MSYTFKNLVFKKLKFLSTFYFLVADTLLYKRLCPFVGLSVDPLLPWSKLKSGKMSVFEYLLHIVGCLEGLGYGWGLDVPAHPSATIL